MTDVTLRVGEVFDDWARRGRAEGMERGHGPTARRAFDRLEIDAEARYLDVGCGNGYTVRWAAGIAPTVQATGIDVSGEMIDRAKEQSGDLANARFVCGSFPSDELVAGTFNAVFSMEVFYYLNDLGLGLRAVRELLVPGGQFACVVDFYRENEASHDWPGLMDLPLHLLSEAEWQEAFITAGLEVVDQTRLRRELSAGDEETWKHRNGSLLTLGRRQD